MQTTSRGPRTFLTKRRLVGILALVALVALGVWGWAYYSSPLPRAAYPVLSTARWAGRSRQNTSPYHWLPNGDLAYLRKDANGIPQVCYQQMDAKGPVGAVRHGPEMPLGIWFDNFCPSPDEQWVAYMQFSRPRTFQTCLLSPDGKTTRKGGEYFLGWLADSRSYLSLQYSQNLVTRVFHVDTPRSETIAQMDSGVVFTPSTTVPSGPSFVMSSHFYHPPTNTGTPQNSLPIPMRSFPVVHPDLNQVRWQAAIPTEMTAGTAYASPDNRSLLWEVGKQRSGLWSDWLGRLNAKWRQDPTFDMHYFLSDLHGNHMRPILNNVLGGTPNLAPTWTPDSKHLSFIYKDQLYLIPID